MDRKRALVFDDEPDIRKLFRMLLECRGYEVFTFEDPSDYCDLQNIHCPLALNARCADVIVSDVKMPRVDGLQFMQAIMDWHCRVPARALMSGYWTPTSLDTARSLGCHVFSKPMRVGEIFDWLAACEKQRTPTSLAALNGCGYPLQAIGY